MYQEINNSHIPLMITISLIDYWRLNLIAIIVSGAISFYS